MLHLDFQLQFLLVCRLGRNDVNFTFCLEALGALPVRNRAISAQNMISFLDGALQTFIARSRRFQRFVFAVLDLPLDDIAALLTHFIYGHGIQSEGRKVSELFSWMNNEIFSLFDSVGTVVQIVFECKRILMTLWSFALTVSSLGTHSKAESKLVFKFKIIARF